MKLPKSLLLEKTYFFFLENYLLWAPFRSPGRLPIPGIFENQLTLFMPFVNCFSNSVLPFFEKYVQINSYPNVPVLFSSFGYQALALLHCANPERFLDTHQGCELRDKNYADFWTCLLRAVG